MSKSAIGGLTKGKSRRNAKTQRGQSSSAKYRIRGRLEVNRERRQLRHKKQIWRKLRKWGCFVQKMHESLGIVDLQDEMKRLNPRRA